ncbi:MAG: hypothetical protein EHM89_01315 [Acidobacteria bacterium]|jgi:hypothetical protein|nr:MAG: hypothetical protein EHM89_01315 [Acidobacteriota bacterium]
MASVLFEYQPFFKGPTGMTYRARTCGSEMEDGRWQGWVEFLPPKGGRVLLSPRETIQPNRTDLTYWASRLTPVYLEGALVRALDRHGAKPLFDSMSHTGGRDESTRG